MHPILFKIGPVPIHSYGTMIAIGFALSAFLVYRRAGIFGIDRDFALDLLVFALLAGIAGARAFYVGLNFGYYVSNPLEIPNLAMGGLVWYGGFASAVIFSVLYCRIKGVDTWSVLDLVAPFLALAQAIGRIGCFLNGCCYGRGGHPAQLYSAAALALIFIILYVRQSARVFSGEVFLFYCMLYPAKRFFVEFFRGDNARIFAGLTLSQAISIPFFIAAVVLFAKRRTVWKKNASTSK